MKKIIQQILLLPLVLSISVVYAQKEFVQRILLDKPVTAGSLKVFPLVEDPNSYFYLPNKVRLGTDDNGTPQFSFIRFVPLYEPQTSLSASRNKASNTASCFSPETAICLAVSS